eukprot:33341-Chlamydomonas_euryale.AAC.1
MLPCDTASSISRGRRPTLRAAPPTQALPRARASAHTAGSRGWPAPAARAAALLAAAGAVPAAAAGVQHTRADGAWM